jgi:hypothetical protein
MSSLRFDDITLEEFLASNPQDHPDFGMQPTDYPAVRPMLLPNLVTLIHRMGGLDAIPDVRAEGPVAWIPAIDILASVPDGERFSAMLRDRQSHHVHAELYRMGPNTLMVEGWHPHDPYLCISFDVPADWAAGAWTVREAVSEDMFSATAELDALVAASCERRIGLVQDPAETYCLIRRDVFRP